MAFELEGRIHTILQVEEKGRFTKREFVLETSGRYQQTILFQTVGDKVSILDGFAIGDEVRVEFAVKGREWRPPTGGVRFFNSLDVWKIQRIGAQQSLPAGGSDSSRSTPTPAPEDDIPF